MQASSSIAERVLATSASSHNTGIANDDNFVSRIAGWHCCGIETSCEIAIAHAVQPLIGRGLRGRPQPPSEIAHRVIECHHRRPQPVDESATGRREPCCSPLPGE